MTQTFSRITEAVPRMALVLAGVLGLLSLASWYFVAETNMPLVGAFNPLAFGLFTLIWAVGMTAMMFPSLLPTVYALAVSARREMEDKSVSRVAQKLFVTVRASMFILGYVITWTLVGMTFYLAVTGTSALGFPPALWSYGILAGVILVATGLYQFTRFKQRALMKCRSPMSFILTRWRNGNIGAGWMGADYGFFCTKCCWVLMFGLLIVGTMSLPLMGLFALIIFTEKIFPQGQIISRIVGAAFLAAGIYLLA